MKLNLLLLGVILIHLHGFGQYAAKLTGDADTEEPNVKLVSNNGAPLPLELKMKTGKRPASGSVSLVLQNTDLTVMNSLEDPEHIVPGEAPLEVNRKTLKLPLDTYSLTILKIKIK